MYSFIKKNPSSLSLKPLEPVLALCSHKGLLLETERESTSVRLISQHAAPRLLIIHNYSTGAPYEHSFFGLT